MEQSTRQIALEVSRMNTYFPPNHIVKDFSISLDNKETIAIVGQTGSGKSVAISSLLNLLDPKNSKVSYDRISFIGGQPLDKIRAKEIGIVFQNARVAFNPIIKCGKQILRVLNKHTNHNKKELKIEVFNLLDRVGLKEPHRIYNSFPHQISGGELQRIMIAMAICCKPQILILDEPTASLDKIVQFRIVKLLQELQKEEHFALILVSHDLEMVSELADKIIHIHEGEIVARQKSKDFFLNPESEVSQNLVRQLKEMRLGDFLELESDELLMNVKNLGKYFNSSGKYAFSNIALKLHKGERLGLIGESGSGKSSLGKCLAGIWDFQEGTIKLQESKLKVSYVFQDAYSAMDPEMTIHQILNEVIRLNETSNSPKALLEDVLLSQDVLEKMPEQLSGGQRQRVNLARALATKPDILICDEITSGLDLHVQTDILDLLANHLRNLSIIFISHDISLVKYFCHSVLVLQNGSSMYYGPTSNLFTRKQEGYVEELINSVYKVKYFLNM